MYIRCQKIAILLKILLSKNEKCPVVELPEILHDFTEFRLLDWRISGYFSLRMGNFRLFSNLIKEYFETK